MKNHCMTIFLCKLLQNDIQISVKCIMKISGALVIEKEIAKQVKTELNL